MATDERTIINNESTTFNHNSASGASALESTKTQLAPTDKTNANNSQPASNSGVWKKVMVGGVAAVSAGAIAAFYANAKSAQRPVELNEFEDNYVDVVGDGDGAVFDTSEAEEITAVNDGETEEFFAINDDESSDTPDFVVEDELAEFAPLEKISEISTGIATSVSDDMSFSQAFATARAEVGRGGVFEWHGQLFNTYYKEEWDTMTPAEQNFFANHVARDAANGNYDNYLANNQNDTIYNDEIIIIENEDDYAMVDLESNNEVEVFGIVHDDENQIDMVGIEIDGVDIIAVDVNQDGSVDYLIADTDGDGELSSDEVMDIADSGLTVNDVIGLAGDAPIPTISSDLLDDDPIGDLI